VRALPASSTSLGWRPHAAGGSPEHQCQRHLNAPRQPRAEDWRWRAWGACRGGVVGARESGVWRTCSVAGSWRWLWGSCARGFGPGSGSAVRVMRAYQAERLAWVVVCMCRDVQIKLWRPSGCVKLRRFAPARIFLCQCAEIGTASALAGYQGGAPSGYIGRSKTCK
jgi:hypothetical protein